MRTIFACAIIIVTLFVSVATPWAEESTPMQASPTSFADALKIGDNNPTWGGVTPLGDTYRIFISNIMSRAQHTILIAGSLSESTLTNILKYDAPGDPITYESGTENTRNLSLTNIRTIPPSTD